MAGVWRDSDLEKYETKNILAQFCDAATFLIKDCSNFKASFLQSRIEDISAIHAAEYTLKKKISLLGIRGSTMTSILCHHASWFREDGSVRCKMTGFQPSEVWIGAYIRWLEYPSWVPQTGFFNQSITLNTDNSPPENRTTA